MKENINGQNKDLAKVTDIIQEVTTEQKTMELKFDTEVVKVVDSAASEYTKLMVDVRVEALEEAKEVALDHCLARANQSSSSSCCLDCRKPQFRIPSLDVCKEKGCSGECVFELSSCDAKGKAATCKFPFTHGGKAHSKCITTSLFGTTKRPWCMSESGSPAFCDCPITECLKETAFS